ncbi:RNA polymerase sigma factor [Niastella sp. OAS944]|uniref:RNA polymerase sigma factor n=1 Tax=Niastella sp. OAS944 TaxID=2664089 RepID=UPI003490AE39|nr:RNA polymerase sigma-70 factor (ECF subfamily) [Chitinophagaceae bacterium OAS944]
MKHDSGYNLVALFNKGDERAFRGLYQQLYPSILVVANKIVSNTQEAQDICTDSFIKLFQTSEKFESIQNIKAFLFTLTRNACLNSLKKQATHSHGHKQLRYLMEDKEELFKDEVEAELVEMVYCSIEKLPKKCRNVFKMTLLGYSYEEIADHYKISISTVRNQKARGLKLIRIALLNEKDLSRALAIVSILISLFSQKSQN